MSENAIETTDNKAKVPVPLDGPLADADQAWRLALFFAAADIVPQDLRNKPANAFLVILYGQRLGLPPEIALSTVSVVKGKPRMAGQLLLAKVREAGHKAKIVHGDNECTVTITRDDGDEHTETFTLAEAVKARLCTLKDGQPHARSKSGEPLPWETYTKRMLQWRAVGVCVDVICPEVKMGFVVEGELDEPAQERPTLAQVAAQRMDKQPDPPAADPPSDAVAEEEATVVEDDAPPAEEQIQADLLADLADIEAEHAAEYPDGDQ
jgi:hypothetical protein